MIVEIAALVVAAGLGFGAGRVSSKKLTAELDKLVAAGDADLKAAVAKVKAALHIS
jgi:hypothetical protein